MTETPSGKVEEIKQKVISLKEAGFSQEEINEINTSIQGLNEPELTEVITYLKANLPRETAEQITILRGTLETLQGGEDMFAKLAETNKLEIFADIFDNKEKLEVFKSILTGMSREQLGDSKFDKLFLGDAQKESLNLVVWNKILKEMSLGSTISFGVSEMVGKVASSIPFFGDGKETNEGKSALEKIGGTLKDLKNLWDSASIMGNVEDLIKNGFSREEAEQKIKELSDKGGKLVEELVNYLIYLVEDYYKNLNNLYQVADKEKLLDDTRFQSLLENPVILNEILETGKYNKDGYEIDITNSDKGKIRLSTIINPTDLPKARDEFLEVINKNANDFGKNIDGLRGWAKRIGSFFEKIGFDSMDKIKSFKAMIEKIPLFGPILGMFFGFILGDSVLDMIEESFDLKKYKESIEKFKKFAEDSENLPYKKAEYSQEDEVNIAKFLKKVDKKAEVEKEKIDFNKSFWEKIFSSEKGEENSLLERIRVEVEKLKPTNGDDISQSDFLRKLRGITIKNAQILETPAVLTSADGITAPDGTPTEPATPAEGASVVTLVSTPASTPEAPGSQNPTELPTSSQTTTPSQTLPQQEISSSGPQEISDNSIPLDRISEVESLPVLIDFGNGEKEIISIGGGNKGKDIYIGEKKFTIKMIAGVTDFDKSDIFSELEFKGGKLIIRTSSVIIKEIHYEGEQFKKFTSEFASLRDLEINKSLPSKTKSQMGYSVTSTITRIA